MQSIPVYLEVGRRRTFAGAVDWPGWSRAGSDEESAKAALVEYAPRYAAALGEAAKSFRAPRDSGQLEVVERLEGDATTDFGAPGKAPASDELPTSAKEAARLKGLLQTSWAAFDRAAEAASSKVLRKGPRGGGRELDRIVTHVLEAQEGYLATLWARHRSTDEGDAGGGMTEVREAVLAALDARYRGEPLPKSRRSSPWSPRYFIRRSAWHALDHAWEIEDRAE